MFPENNEYDQIMKDAVKCDGSCKTTGKCPRNLQERISNARVKLTEVEMNDPMNKF